MKFPLAPFLRSFFALRFIKHLTGQILRKKFIRDAFEGWSTAHSGFKITSANRKFSFPRRGKRDEGRGRQSYKQEGSSLLPRSVENPVMEGRNGWKGRAGRCSKWIQCRNQRYDPLGKNRHRVGKASYRHEWKTAGSRSENSVVKQKKWITMG